MIKNIILSTVAVTSLVAVIGPALSADLPNPKVTPRFEAPAPVPTFTWLRMGGRNPSGFYLVGGVKGLIGGDGNQIAPEFGVGYQFTSKWNFIDGAQAEVLGKYGFRTTGASYSQVLMAGNIMTCSCTPGGPIKVGSFQDTLYGYRGNTPGLQGILWSPGFGQRLFRGIIDDVRIGGEVSVDFENEGGIVQGTYAIPKANIQPVNLDKFQKSFVDIGVGPVGRIDKGNVGVKAGYLFDVSGQQYATSSMGTNQTYKVGSTKGRWVFGADYRF